MRAPAAFGETCGIQHTVCIESICTIPAERVRAASAAFSRRRELERRKEVASRMFSKRFCLSNEEHLEVEFFPFLVRSL